MMKKQTNYTYFRFFVQGFFLVQNFCLFSQSLDSVQTLQGVTVSAAARPRVSANIGQLQSLNVTSLERLNAVQLSDAVKYFAGATVKDYGGIGGLKTVSVRSLGASHTGVFADKIPISNAMNGQIDLSRFTLDHIGEIQLSNDNFSTHLQTASFYSKSSQLSLISARPTFDEHQKTQVDVSLKMGSFGLFNPQFNINRFLNVARKPQLISLNADYQKAKGNYPFKLVNGNITTTETRNNSAVESYRMDLMWQNFSDSRQDYFFKANYYYSHRQLPGPVILYNISSNQEMWDQEKSLQGQYNYRFADSTEILFSAKISETFHHYMDHDYLGPQPLDHRFIQTERFGSAAIQSRRYKGFQTSLSSDIFYHKMRSNLHQYAYPTRLTSLTNLALNYTLQSVLFYGHVLQTSIFEQAESTDIAKNRYKLSPTFGLNFQPQKNPNFSARFFYKETYRMPTFNELYYTNMGNTNLLPESAKQFNIGVSAEKSFDEKKYIAISVDGYHNQITDKIIAMPRTNLFTWLMQNVGKVDVWGVDATLKSGFDANKKLNFYSEISYTFQDAKDMSDVKLQTYKQQIPYTPKHSGSIIFGANYVLTLQYSLMFSSERDRLGVNSPRDRLDAYFDHSILLSKNFSIKKTDLKLAFEILNLTNKNYEIISRYPMPGRQYRLTVKWRIE